MTKAYSYIRMSTDLQLKGDSRRRQLEASEAYAANNGLELVRDFNLEDIGVSAFKGANIATGELGRFLEAVRADEIDHGSYLLLESLDRLSRQDINASLSIFLDLLNAGINIVTLADGHVYQAGKTELTDLIVSLVIMSRAHEESVTKSKRIGAAWANKRSKVASRKLTAQCPAWLRLVDNRAQFELIEERAEVVRNIFEDCAAGLGSYTITKRLNRSRTPVFGRSNGWLESYVTKILKNRAVLGEFQPYRIDNGQRSPAGDPIPDYFPRIVSDELFNRAQRSRMERRTGAGGRRGEFTSNLFSRIATCGYCGAPMRHVDKGRPPKGFRYLVCQAANRGLGCEKTSWRYEHFEASVLAFVKELDLEAMAAGSDEAEKRAEIEKKIHALTGQIDELRRRRDRTFELIASETPSDFIKQKLAEIENDIAAAESQCEQLQETLNSKMAEAGRLYESKDQIKGLIQRLQSPTSDDVFILRAQIAAKLKTLVEQLKVFPSGVGPMIEGKIRSEIESTDARDNERIDSLRQVLSIVELGREKCFVVALKGGLVRVVFPDPDDPLQFSELSEHSAGKLEITLGDEETFSIHPAKGPLDWDLAILLRAMAGPNSAD